MAEFGEFMTCGSKNIFKNEPSCTNTHRDVADSVNQGMVKNTKTWISWERNIIFSTKKKNNNLNLCLRWHILRSYRFVVEVTFNDICGADLTDMQLIQRHDKEICSILCYWVLYCVLYLLCAWVIPLKEKDEMVSI